MLGTRNAGQLMGIGVGVGIFVGFAFPLLAGLFRRRGWGGGDLAIRDVLGGVTGTRGFRRGVSSSLLTSRIAGQDEGGSGGRGAGVGRGEIREEG